MKERKGIIAIFIIMILAFNLYFTYAEQAPVKQIQEESVQQIILSDEGILVNNEAISTVDTNNMYLSNGMSNGGTSENAMNANIQITNVVNIKNSGTYEFTAIQ